MWVMLSVVQSDRQPFKAFGDSWWWRETTSCLCRRPSKASKQLEMKQNGKKIALYIHLTACEVWLPAQGTNEQQNWYLIV